MADRTRLGVIFGGQSLEHEVSVVSAQYVMEAARDRFEVVPIGVTKEGAWLTPEETQLQLDREDEKFHKTLELEGERGILARPKSSRDRTLLMPTLLPPLAGFTNAG